MEWVSEVSVVDQSSCYLVEENWEAAVEDSLVGRSLEQLGKNESKMLGHC